MSRYENGIEIIEFDDNFEMRPDNDRLKTGFIDFLEYTKENLNPKRVLEIGTFKGESMQLFKDYLGEDITFITIDPWTKIQWSTEIDHKVKLDFAGNFEQSTNEKILQMENVGKMKFKSDDIHEMFADGYFDMIYIDGDHSYEAVRNDILNYMPKVKSGGWVCGHDYNHNFAHGTFAEALTKSIDDTLGKPDMVFEDSSWIHKKA